MIINFRKQLVAKYTLYFMISKVFNLWEEYKKNRKKYKFHDYTILTRAI